MLNKFFSFAAYTDSHDIAVFIDPNARDAWAAGQDEYSVDDALACENRIELSVDDVRARFLHADDDDIIYLILAAELDEIDNNIRWIVPR